MSTANTGPPDKWQSPRNGQGPGAHHRNTFQGPQYPTRHPQPLNHADALRRRRAASQTLPPLGCGRRDPWWYPPLGRRGYEPAALHLLEHGLLPAADREGLKAMRNRKAAQRITQAWEQAA